MPTKRGLAAVKSQKRSSIAAKGGRAVSRNRKGATTGTPLRGVSSRTPASPMSRTSSGLRSVASRAVSGVRSMASKSPRSVRGTTARKPASTSRRGFAAMAPAKRRTIASKGGRARKSA